MPLYKYQPFPAKDLERQGWVREILVEHRLFFASRKCFNDPFDCVVPSLLETPGTVVKLLAEEFVDGKFPSSSPDEWLSKVSKLMSVQALKGLRQDVQKNVDEAGIACFSKVRDDILMWAHYADKHRGFYVSNLTALRTVISSVRPRPWNTKTSRPSLWAKIPWRS